MSCSIDLISLVGTVCDGEEILRRRMKMIGVPLDKGDQWLQETVWTSSPSGSTVRLIATDVSPSEFRSFPSNSVPYTSSDMYQSSVSDLVQSRRTVLSNSRPGGFICSLCNKSYTFRQSLHRHRKFECGKDPQFQCPYCSKRTKQKCALVSHLKRKHGLMVQHSKK